VTYLQQYNANRTDYEPYPGSVIDIGSATNARCSRCAFSVWTQFTVQTGKRSELPRGMPLVTRLLASSELAWGPMASSSVNFCRKTRTVRSGTRHGSNTISGSSTLPPLCNMLGCQCQCMAIGLIGARPHSKSDRRGLDVSNTLPSLYSKPDSLVTCV
jgi:hypothetical protein